MEPDKHPLTNDLARWSNKAQAAKGGTVIHRVPDLSKHKKMCCDKMMGEKCDCTNVIRDK